MRTLLCMETMKFITELSEMIHGSRKLKDLRSLS